MTVMTLASAAVAREKEHQTALPWYLNIFCFLSYFCAYFYHQDKEWKLLWALTKKKSYTCSLYSILCLHTRMSAVCLLKSLYNFLFFCSNSFFIYRNEISFKMTAVLLLRQSEWTDEENFLLFIQHLQQLLSKV